MPDIGETLSGAIPTGGTIGMIFIMLAVGAVATLILGFVGWRIYNKKRWNLKVEIKLPRSDGKIVNGEWGKGYFNSKQGVVYIRRPGFAQPKIPLKIFDPKRYLQGTDLLTVVQLSPLDYRPVLPRSYLEYNVEYEEDDPKHKDYGKKFLVKEAVMDMECDTGASKAWQTSFEAASKQAYSLKSFLTQFQTPIAIAIVLVAVFVGIAALWTQLPG